MAKNVVVGDVLVKGAHKYTVVQVEKVMHTDLVVIAYKTLKTETIRTMQVAATEFVKVEQVEEVAADPVDAMDEEQYRKAIINGEIKGDWYVWLRKKLDISRSQFPLDHDMEKEAYRICVESMAEGNEEEGAGYFDNLNDEYGDIERARSHKESVEVAAEVNETFSKNDNVVVHKVNAWNSEFFSDFQFVLEVAGNEFGYYMRKDEYGGKEFKVMVFGHNDFHGRQQVLAYANDLQGVEDALNNFLSKGFMFFCWEMKAQEVRVKVVDAMEAFVQKIKEEQQEPTLVATYELGGILVDVYEDQTKDVPFSVTVPVPPKYSTSEHKYKSATKTFERESLERMHELMDYIGYRLVKEENGKFYIEVDSFDVDAGDVVKEKVFFDSENPATPSHGFEMHPGYGNIPKDEVAAEPEPAKEIEDDMYTLIIEQFGIKRTNVNSSKEVKQIVENIKINNPHVSLTTWHWDKTALLKNGKKIAYIDFSGQLIDKKGNVIKIKKGDSPFTKHLRGMASDTTAEVFAIAFRVTIENILTSRHVFGDKHSMDLIQELNAAYVDEKLKRRL